MDIIAPQFSAESADQVWRQAASALIGTGDYHRQDSRLGPTREILHCSFILKDPRQRWVLSRRPAINPAFAIAEVVWILRGRDDASFLKFWNPVLSQFCGDGPRFYGAYGQRLRENLRFDQLERAFEALSANPTSRQIVLQIWDGERDFPYSDGRARDADIPCNVCSMLKIRNGRLDWTQVMRSNDLFLGTPHNFVQFTVLQEVMAGWLGLQMGPYVQISDSLHLYEKDLAAISMTETAPEAHLPESLALPKPEFDKMIIDFEAVMDELANGTLTQQHFRKRMADLPFAQPWANLLRVAAADAARRQGWRDEMAACIAACTNPILSAAWNAWEQRRKQEVLTRTSHSSA